MWTSFSAERCGGCRACVFEQHHDEAHALFHMLLCRVLVVSIVFFCVVSDATYYPGELVLTSRRVEHVMRAPAASRCVRNDSVSSISSGPSWKRDALGSSTSSSSSLSLSSTCFRFKRTVVIVFFFLRQYRARIKRRGRRKKRECGVGVGEGAGENV